MKAKTLNFLLIPLTARLEYHKHRHDRHCCKNESLDKVWPKFGWVSEGFRSTKVDMDIAAPPDDFCTVCGNLAAHGALQRCRAKHCHKKAHHQCLRDSYNVSTDGGDEWVYYRCE